MGGGGGGVAADSDFGLLASGLYNKATYLTFNLQSSTFNSSKLKTAVALAFAFFPSPAPGTLAPSK